ncbi:4Fe-4S dicluster domain-containing protein [Carboxydothermus ferrireducens]|uniref:Fe-S-cluster-containing dehydrogenase component n=1 Tax=Carboxydothermus ferrireducens DSM 11255 TaxID=1119529 RepID=A0ABX2R8I2_9THEO|nr:4Fe-4S dicluster domain-containing protein [Carboxydothermus ferrireducens]NYE57483.1 Fe-S-cluster-containing dehydrogenase component [Carboxydothermus ferrireducens DSM 11255]
MQQKKMSRREFLRKSLIAGAAGVVALHAKPSYASPNTQKKYAMMIDLTKCTGCESCVLACREENRHKFPEPVHPIPVNWPTGKYDDWSDKREVRDRLTPYNWTIVQTVEILRNGQIEKINIPRHCMHCDNPPCANLCPFGANTQTPEGAVVIDDSSCLGGAKCQAVCPWGIPQRQGGVGLYMKIAPGLLGGGVMYKCDFCHHRLTAGKVPACVESCPHGAITFGEKEEIIKLARERAKEINGYIYGEKENGGTSVLYVSHIPFSEINEALIKQGAGDKKSGKPAMPTFTDNPSDAPEHLVKSLALAPLAGLLTAGITAYKTFTKEGSKHEND